MLHSQGLFNNPCPEPNQSLILIPISLSCILILFYHLRPCLPEGLFPVGLPINILKALVFSSIQAT